MAIILLFEGCINEVASFTNCPSSYPLYIKKKLEFAYCIRTCRQITPKALAKMAAELLIDAVSCGSCRLDSAAPVPLDGTSPVDGKLTCAADRRMVGGGIDVSRKINPPRSGGGTVPAVVLVG